MTSNRRAKIAQILLVILVSVIIACVSTPESPDMRDTDWALVEVQFRQASSPNIIIDRAQSPQGFDNFFTLRFDAERVNGVGAPNRFFAPYTLEDKQGITIGLIAGTLMALLFEPGDLTESVFFGYLQNAGKWDIAGGNLELYSKTDDGAEVVLVFAPAALTAN